MKSIVCGFLRIRIFHGQNAPFIHSNPYQDRKNSISRVVPEQLEGRCRNVKKLETRTSTKRRKRFVLRIRGGCGKNRGVVLLPREVRVLFFLANSCCSGVDIMK